MTAPGFDEAIVEQLDDLVSFVNALVRGDLRRFLWADYNTLLEIVGRLRERTEELRRLADASP